MRTPTGATRLAGVIGHPVRYSLSPALHNAAYEQLGLDAVYLALPVEGQHAAAAVESIRALDMIGVSVTIPLKESVVPFLDGMTNAAERLGAVNCISNIEGQLIGHNTDGAGFVASVREVGFDPLGKTVALFGAGGSAKAVAVALADAGVSKVKVVNHNEERAKSLAALDDVIEVGCSSDVEGCDLIVNATPIGMDGKFPGELPFDADLLRSTHCVADLVYHPLETPLLEAAAEKGAMTVVGTGMLLHQAAEQIKLWTGLHPPIEVMRKALQL